MSLTDKLKNIEMPNFNDIIKSGHNAKSKMDNININKVNVHFYYADNRFKTTVVGELKHISEIPICFLEYPEKLAYLVPENTLVYDIKNQIFEISVNEKYAHSIKIDSICDGLEVESLIIPHLPEKYDYHVVSVEGIIDRKDNKPITLTAKMLSSLGRAKILERTLETSNDGLMIMALIGGLVGFVLGMIVGIKSVM